jgi:hypothetical protein
MARRSVATALGALSAVALVLLASAVVVRTIAASFNPFLPYPGHVADYRVARSRAVRAALPDIVDSPRTAVIVMGSSGVARAFVPSVFDDALDGGRKRHMSFNLAQLLLQPETALAMAKLIRQNYEARHKHIGIAVFGISVPELTRGAIRASQHTMPDQAFTFATEELLEARAHADPLGAVDDGLKLLLFGNVRPAQVGRWVEDWAAAHPPPCESGMKQPPDGDEAQAALVDYCHELGAQFPRGVPAWNPSTRGGFDFGLPSTRPMLERLVELHAASPGLAPRVETARSPAGAILNDMDEDAIRTMVAAIRELKAVSNHVVILRDVMNPDLLAAELPARVARWSEVARGIARGSDAPLLDLNDGTFGASDFGDRTHLNPLAAERFSSLLAARVQPMAEEDRASR